MIAHKNNKVTQDLVRTLPKKSAILLTLMLLVSSSNVLKSNSSNNPRLEIYDRLEYSCNWDSYGNYWEECQHFTMFDIFNIDDPSLHNFTIVYDSPEELRIINPKENTLNYTIDGKSVVTKLFSGTDAHLTLGFKTTSPFLDPLNLSFIPSDTSSYSIDKDGGLFFSLLINASEPITNFQITSHQIKQINFINSDLDTELRYGRILVSNTTVGSHRLDLGVQLDLYEEKFNINLIIYKNEATYPIKCFLDGKEICPSNVWTSITYKSKTISYLVGVVPWVYGYWTPNYYTINNTINRREYKLRIDINSREQINFLLFNSTIINFSVEEAEFYSNPYYHLNLHFSTPIQSSLGLVVYEKIWFLRSMTMRLCDIPSDILKKYTNPISSTHWMYIDKGHPLVQLWSKQVVRNETNPYMITYLLCKNLTETLRYDEKYLKVQLKASEVLENKAGVCRHIAWTFAALCMASGLPARCVVGTAYGFFNETYKKNHEWNEVYFPGYGWVTIDVTWSLGKAPDEWIFGRFPSSHTIISLPPGDSLNITNTPYVRNFLLHKKTQDTLLQLIVICKNKLNQIPFRTFPSVQRYVEACEKQLTETITLTLSGYVHYALLSVSRAYILLKTAQNVSNQILLTIFIVPVIVIAIIKRKYILMNLRKIESKIMRARKKRSKDNAF